VRLKVLTAVDMKIAQFSVMLCHTVHMNVSRNLRNPFSWENMEAAGSSMLVQTA
jgi:hypothetical protein